MSTESTHSRTHTDTPREVNRKLYHALAEVHYEDLIVAESFQVWFRGRRLRVTVEEV